MPRNHKSVQKRVVPVLSGKFSWASELWWDKDWSAASAVSEVKHDFSSWGSILLSYRLSYPWLPVDLSHEHEVQRWLVSYCLAHSWWFLAVSLGYANKSEWIAGDLLTVLPGWIWGCISSDGSSEWKYSVKGMLSQFGETQGVPSSSWWSTYYQSWLNVGAAVGRRKRYVWIE